MIGWANPWAFLLLLPVLALAWQPQLTGRLRLRLPGPNTYQSTTSLRRAIAALPGALWILGLTLCVIALARPQTSHKEVIVSSDGIDILLAIDTSGSMRAEDLTMGMRPVNRLEVAKAVMADFVRSRAHDRLGIVAFGEEAFTHVPLTLDHDSLIAVLETVEIGLAGESRTAVGSAIAVAARRLKDLDAPSKVLVLLTDGQSNAGHVGPLEAAQAAAALGIRIYTVGVGAPARRGFFGMMDGVDREELTGIAEATGGRFFMAQDAATLREVYATIDELEPSPAEVEELIEHEELFRRFLTPGLALLALSALLSTTWLRRFP